LLNKTFIQIKKKLRNEGNNFGSVTECKFDSVIVFDMLFALIDDKFYAVRFLGTLFRSLIILFCLDFANCEF